MMEKESGKGVVDVHKGVMTVIDQGIQAVWRREWGQEGQWNIGGAHGSEFMVVEEWLE